MKNVATLLLLAAGCTNSSDALFHVSGRVATGAATHVIASSGTSDARVAVNVGRDGSFDLGIQPGHAWVIAFADARQTGPAMLVGTLQSGSLDTLAPQSAAAMDLGDIAIANGVATASLARDRMIDDLGLNESDAQRIGALDDLAVSLATVDADGDGVIDALQPGHDYRLQMSGDLALRAGDHALSVTDLVAQPAITGLDYAGTGIEVSLPRTYHMAGMANAALTFGQPFFPLVDGADAPMTPPGTPIAQPSLLAGERAGHPVAAVYTRAGHAVPTGTYQFSADDMALEFDNVRMPASATQLAETSLVVPFVHVVPTDASCQIDCNIQSVDYQWMEHTQAGWRAASPAALAVMPAGRLDIVRLRPDGVMQDMHLSIPTTATGSLAWQTSVTGQDLLQNELAGVTTTQFCYFAVAYTDLAGTRLTSAVANPAAACGNH